MIGYLLLVIALYLYTKPKYKYISIILYIGFGLGSFGGYNILTSDVIGVKNKDLASIYTFVVVVFELWHRGLSFQSHSVLKKTMRLYKMFLVFLCLSVIFSLTYYRFSFYEILQGGRDLICMLSLLIILKLSNDDINKVLKYVFYINFITAIIYILQVVVGRNLLPYPYSLNLDPSTGLVRLYNFPVNLYLCLFLSFFASSYIGVKLVVLCRFIFIGALICTQGRTMILMGIFGILLGILLSRKNGAAIRNIIILLIISIPVLNMITDRSAISNESDWEIIKSGGYKNFDMSQSNATMAYRFAWVYERAEYLSKRPIVESVFGFGVISDSQPRVQKMYNFSIGLRDKEDGHIVQLSTPDISYGQMLCSYGYVGSLILLAFLISIAMVLYKYRKRHPVILCAFLFLLCDFINSFSGNQLALPRNYAIIFVLLSFLMNNLMLSENLNRCIDGKK